MATASSFFLRSPVNKVFVHRRVHGFLVAGSSPRAAATATGIWEFSSRTPSMASRRVTASASNESPRSSQKYRPEACSPSLAT